ncbi:MAG: hypothetical protein ACD_75C00442G0005 [uncultured bacterium]|nr:MAG: hypothetical protein ACD_75C00442G0005 [uncultured bacterium]
MLRPLSRVNSPGKPSEKQIRHDKSFFISYYWLYVGSITSSIEMLTLRKIGLK